MSNTGENQAREANLKISDTVRQHALASARSRKVPKMSLERIADGRADHEPLLQSYAKLEKFLDDRNAEVVSELKQQIEKITKERDDIAEERRQAFFNNDKLATEIQNLSSALTAIIARAKGSFFGKAKEIIRIAKRALYL